MLPFRTILALLVSVFCLSTFVFAQKPASIPNGTVKGITVDFLGARVPKVTVVFEGAQGNPTVISDAEGEFEIELPASQYRVTVAKFGIFYTYERKKLRVTARVKKFDVVLKYDTKKYPPLVSNATRRTIRWTRAAGACFVT
jgi:uncharacterized membrane protein